MDRVGATRPVSIDIRVIATTNRDLEREVKAGRFREDLFYRLNVINIVLPPLRERKGDIAVLSDYFLEKYSRSTPLGRCRLTEGALAKLAAYDWPGNVRELENTVYRAALLTPSPDIPPEAMALTDEQSEFYDEFFQLGPGRPQGGSAEPASGLVSRGDRRPHPRLHRRRQDRGYRLFRRTDDCVGRAGADSGYPRTLLR